METISRNIETLSIQINCSYDLAFEYLSKAINQKEWATSFFQDIKVINGETIAFLPFGTLPITIKSDHSSGVLDIYLGDGKPTHTRLINIDSSINIYTFTLSQPKGMPNDVWKNKALPDMAEELNNLKLILESF